MIAVTDAIVLSDDEIKERFIRAPGPGGQNVNKVESAVQLRFDAANSPALPVAVFRRLVPLAGRRMTRDGVIVLTATRFRSQDQNRRDALERLLELIRRAAVEPKRRRPTRPPASSRQRRLDAKHKRSTLKKRRTKASGDEGISRIRDALAQIAELPGVRKAAYIKGTKALVKGEITDGRDGFLRVIRVVAKGSQRFSRRMDIGNFNKGVLDGEFGHVCICSYGEVVAGVLCDPGSQVDRVLTELQELVTGSLFATGAKKP